MSAFFYFHRAFLPFGWALGDSNTFPKESNKKNSKICTYKWTSTMVCFCVLLQLLWMNRLTLWKKTSFARLEWPGTRTIEKILFWDFMDGMKLSPRGQFLWSVVFFFFFPPVLFLGFFFFLFFPSLLFFLSALPGELFSSCHTWPQVFFFLTPTYPP